MTDTRYLACNPTGPGYLNAPHSVRHQGACGHSVMVSPSGVHALLTTPGLKPCCIRCVNRMCKGEEPEWQVLPETAREFTEVTGKELTPEFQAQMQEWVKKVQR